VSGVVEQRNSGERCDPGQRWVARRDRTGFGSPFVCGGGRACAGASNCSVDRGEGDGEQFLEFAEGVLAAAIELDQVGFLLWAELRLLAAHPALGARDGHAFARSSASQIGFELGDHGQSGEQ
jgi:hypothetical protein